MKLAWGCSLVIGLSVSLVSTNCNRPGRAALRDSLLLSTENLEVYYNLNEPQAKYFLPYYLAEISGLTYKRGSLLAVQDEQGILYEFNLESEKIVRSTQFDTRHDFEGVELVGDSVFVLESDGDLRVFSISDSVSGEMNVQTIDTDLSIKNDAEGLGYDPKSHSLLIACKASGEVNQNQVGGKAVYRFDIAAGKLDPMPFFTTSKKDFEKYFEQHKDRDYEAGRFRFEPSAIAINPVDQLYYLMASVGKLIVVFDDTGTIRGTYSIPASLLIQPEGLCFSPEGNLYISSEGDGDKGYIIKYLLKRK